MEKYERDLCRDIMAEMIKPVIEHFVKMGVEWVAAEAYKLDKGRHQPFWTKKWRGR